MPDAPPTLKCIAVVGGDEHSLEFELCRYIRKTVFVDEQRVPVENEFDDASFTVQHFLLVEPSVCYQADGVPVVQHAPVAQLRLRRPVATDEDAAHLPLGLFTDADVWYLGRMAVLPAFRRRGVGLVAIRHVEEWLSANSNGRRVVLIVHAQIDKRSFYERAGCKCTEPEHVFVEEKITHTLMYKQL